MLILESELIPRIGMNDSLLLRVIEEEPKEMSVVPDGTSLSSTLPAKNPASTRPPDDPFMALA